MPSACGKSDIKVAVDSAEAVRQCITVIEKKVRNLEKRKGKLDLIRAKFAEGEEINEEQKEAISKYECVLQTLEFARELQKQYAGMVTDAEKIGRKQAKRDKIERQQQDAAKFRQLLQLQNLLDNMGVESARKDFESGKNGAVLLTEEELTQLDELYKLISPSREGEESYQEQLVKASDHLVNFVEGKDKEVAGSTYQKLLELFNKINDCGYFDRVQQGEEATGEVTEEAGVTEATDNSAAETDALANTDPEETSLQPSDTLEFNPQGLPSADISSFPAGTAQPVSSLQEPTPASLDAPATHTMPMTDESSSYFMVSEDVYSQQTATTAEAAAAAAAQRHRPFQEIVSSVQGSFNFLQDSEIETDPAVVAAHPMVPVSQTDVGLSSQGVYPGGKLLSGAEDPHFVSSVLADPSQDSLVSSAPTHFPAPDQPTFDSTAYSSEQSFSSVLAGDSSQAGLYNNSSEQNYNLGPSIAAVSSASEGPQPIPLPSQTRPGQSLAAGAAPSYGQTGNDSSAPSFGSQSESQTFSATSNDGQSYGVVESQSYGSTGSQAFGSGDASQAYGTAADSQSLSAQEKKTFTMNPHANIFQSMYTQGGGGASMTGGQQFTTAPSVFDTGRKTFAQTTMQQQQQQQQPDFSQGSGGSFGGSGFNNSQSGSGNTGGFQGQRSGGQRGGGGNRGNRGSGGMNGNYSRGGDRGGPRGGGGSSYSGRGGGNYTNSRGNQRGGGSMYQGYPPRGDYRPEGGYQGYTSGSGGMRNGPPSRGGSGGGMRGGGGRGGSYGRTNNMQQGGPMSSGSS